MLVFNANFMTFFLDEIAKLSPEAQVNLLRALQEQQFGHVGGTRTIEIDVRVIATTRRDPDRMVRDGSGNVREFQNIVDRALIITRRTRLRLPELGAGYQIKEGHSPVWHTQTFPTMNQAIANNTRLMLEHTGGGRSNGCSGGDIRLI